MPPSERFMRVAYHESGHGLIARHLGCAGVQVHVLSLPDGPNGYTRWTTGPTNPFDRACIALGGPVAEMLFNAQHSVIGEWDAGIAPGTQDAEQLTALSQQEFERAVLEVKRILEERWPELEAFVRTVLPFGVAVAEKGEEVPGDVGTPHTSSPAKQ